MSLPEPPFAQHLGVTITSSEPHSVKATLVAGPHLMNRNGTLHGGAVMGFADHLGGTGAFLNIGPGDSTATVESKTNFLRPVRQGDLLSAEAVPLHLGATIQLWQTTLTRPDGKTAAIVTQTQIVLKEPRF